MVLTPTDSIFLDFEFAKEVRDTTLHGEVQAPIDLAHVLEEATTRVSTIKGSLV